MVRATGPGLGDDFMDAADECFRRIRTNPAEFPVIYKSVRRALLRRFSFCIYFVLVENVSVVIAVLHGRRSPAVWKRRSTV